MDRLVRIEDSPWRKAMSGQSQRVGPPTHKATARHGTTHSTFLHLNPRAEFVASTQQEMQEVAIISQTSSRNFVLIVGLALYCGAFAILLGNPSFEPAAAVVVLVVFGIVLPLTAWLTTRNAVPLSISDQSGVPELIVLIAYVIAVSLYLIGGPQWIDSIYRADGLTLSRLNSSLHWRKSCWFSLLFPLRFFDSVSVIAFAISAFSDRACVRYAEVICSSFSR